MFTERFKSEELPYKKLEEFGLTREMIDDLPMVVSQRMMAGMPTPPLPIKTDSQEGKKILSLARLTLVRTEKGEVDIRLAPRWTARDLENYTESQQRNLLNGKVIMAESEEKGMCYCQYDDCIQQVISVPVAVIKHNVYSISGIEVKNSEAEQILKGKVVELDSPYGGIVSIGIDLEGEYGIRFANGDAELWEQDRNAERLPKYNFGIFGCWQADENNCMSYISENEYTEEIWEEQRRAAQQSRVRANMSHLQR
jgi:hypothetical protein